MSKLDKPSDQQLRAARSAYADANVQAEALIRPISVAKWAADFSWNGLDMALADFERDWGGLSLNPPFQRGHVWTSEQQTRFIENVMRGVVTDAGLVIQFNAPHWDDSEYAGELPREVQCVDGLQRLTAVREYVAGRVLAFGRDVSGFAGSRYDVRRLSTFRLRFAMHAFQTQAELLTYYLDLNTGGTVHSEGEIARVRAMRDAATDGRA